MKKKRFVLSIILIITIFTLLPLNNLGANPENLVDNGNFDGGSLGYWNTWGDIRMYQDSAGLYSTSSATAGISQKINTSQKKLIFSCDISPRYSGSSSGIQIAFNIYKNGSQLGQAFGYFNNLAPMQFSHISFEVEDFWHNNTGANYADFDQIEIVAETYNGCIAFFDNFSLESSGPIGTSLNITKDSTAKGVGYLTWTIEKSVDKNSFDLSIGTTATAKFTVKVSPVYHETGITVNGTINIANSGNETASVSYVKDRIEYKVDDGPWTELTTESIGGPFTIPAVANKDVPYSVSFAPVEGATEYQNTALVGLENYAQPGGGVGFHEFSYTAGFSVSGGNITSDAYAAVTDSLQGDLGEAWVGDPGTYEYTYSKSVGPYNTVGNYKIGNIATVTGKDTNTKVTDSASIKVNVTGKGAIKVHKELTAPDGKSEPLIPDNHGFKITLQKSTSSGWEDVESRTIKDGGSQVFDADLGVSYRVIEAKDDDYVQIGDSETILLEKNGQNIDVFLKNKQKPALIKVYLDSSGSNISDDHWFWVKLKGGNQTIYQPFNESFYTFFVVWPGQYTVAEFPETDYKFENDDGPLKAVSNGNYKIYKDWIKVIDKDLLLSSKIVFNSQRDGNADEIYIMNANGSGQTRLTNIAANDHSPCFSTDGTKIVFCSSRDGSADEIYIMNADGSGQTRLTNNGTNDVSPCFSPDGTKIAFVGYRSGSAEIYIMNADGSGQTRLTNNTVSDMYPCFSPDGVKLAFGSTRDHPNGDIYIMNADGSEQTRLTYDAANNAYPCFSPDGIKIAFGSPRDNDWEIYIMNADGSGQVKLTDNTASDGFPCFSPDGTKIVFTSYRDGNNSEIYIMNADGSEQINLTNNSGMDDHPSFN